MVQIKICGIRDIKVGGFCVDQGVDFLGLVFYPPSKRYIDIEAARSIVRAFQGRVKFVGVFLDTDRGEVNRTAEYVGVDYVQLHGKVSPAYCRDIVRPVIKAFGVSANFNFNETTSYQQNILYYLFDNSKAGSGQTFDWSKLKNIRDIPNPVCIKPFFLSGGLTPENVRNAIQEISPMGVDVSSGVETEGRKDLTKIKQFIENCR